MKRELLGSAIDAVDQPVRIEGSATRGLIDHRGLAEPPGKIAELIQSGMETVEQQRAVLAVERDDCFAVERGECFGGFGLNHDEWLTGTGKVIAGHGPLTIAQSSPPGYARNMTQSLQDLLATPDACLHSLEADDAILVPMDGDAYRRSIFLDHRISPAGEGGWRVPAASLAAAVPAARPLGWIFHVAHCGSTLLARALDELGGGLVLREPLALRQLALQENRVLLPAVLALLSRRYPGSGMTVVKANVPVNFMLDAIADHDPQAPVVLLWSRLPDYLGAVLRSANHRGWVRNITALLAGQLGVADGMSDARRAAALWAGQHRRFAKLLDRMPHARALEAERFYRDPAAALGQAARLFGIEVKPADIAAVAGGPLFATYSKNPALVFDNAARESMKKQQAQALSAEIAEARGWLAGNAPDAEALVRRLDSASLVS